ncbi:Rho guanine nucleotide exchange factor [Marasmius sp. AFHP31]|nr:Rho guanine nucleotide exchange factor [Marasmius sp. AFHP31]
MLPSKSPYKEALDGFPTQHGTGKFDTSLKAGSTPLSRKSKQKEESKETEGVKDEGKKPPHKELKEQPAVVKDGRKAVNVDLTRKQAMTYNDTKTFEKGFVPEAEPEVKTKDGHALDANKKSTIITISLSSQHHRTTNEVETDTEVIQIEDTKSMGSAKAKRADEELHQIKAFLEDAEKCRKVVEKEGDEAQRWLDFLQTLMGSDYDRLPRQSKSTMFKVMLRLSKKSGMFPRCLRINNVERLGSHPVAGGGFGDVWKGKIAGETVCLKVVKVYLASDVEQLLREYMQEAIVWQQLRHPNLLPFVGMYYFGEGQGQLCLVSPWMERGNLVTFLKNAPPEQVDHTLLAYDVASGLAHLHDMKIVHGDMKGVNVLITPEGRAAIGDFGLSHVADSHALKLSTSFTSRAKGTTRWLAPELLRSTPPSISTVQSDMYAYGCVCYEIFAGRAPFYELGEGAVIVAVLLDQKHPSRPEDLEVDDEIWELMTSCWKSDPTLRPTAAEALARIQRLWSTQGGSGDIQDAPDWKAFDVDAIRSNVEYPRLDLEILSTL